MRKSKISRLFDWASYDKAEAALRKSPEGKENIKAVEQQNKALRVFQSAVTKDIKLGLKELQEALKKGEEAKIPYFLHLDYFCKGKDVTGSLLILGTHPTVRKEFIAAGKTGEKVNLSYGLVQLEANNVLRFIPEKNGMSVKPKALVDRLKQFPISKSNPGFWSKRKVNNVLIGGGEETEKLTGNSDLLEGEVSYTEQGTNSRVYDVFKSFVNRDYISSNGTRNAEYYAQTLNQVDEWFAQLQKEYKGKGDRKLQKAYTKMGKMMLLFKKKVEKERRIGRAQNINEDSNLTSIEQVFMRTLGEYESSKEAYQQSVLKAKLERILWELAQKMDVEENRTEATALHHHLKGLMAGLSNAVTVSPTIEPAVQQEFLQLVEEVDELLQQYRTTPLA